MQSGCMLYVALLLTVHVSGKSFKLMMIKLANTMAALQEARRKWHAQMMTTRLRDDS